EIRALTVLGGHLARAARLQSELWRRGARLGALLELVDRVAWGVVLLDPRRRIVHANPEARRLAAEGDGIAFTGGQLVAVDARDAAALRAAIAGAVGGESFSGPARGDLLLLSRAPHRRPLEVAITPLPLDGASERSRFRPLLEDLEHPAAAILLADPERSADGFAGALTRLYQLTPAEASIAAGIAKGSRISAIALERGVSEQTVRSQIKSVFEKTDTTSQGELAAMLAASLQRYVLGAV
ncbi:MAG TPA: LuxR C-terminal-related transcriptional regulator, partial [Candidatus Limnocylindrales bacterium]|nr:LuxR C-terminal-related transcriptional regulator [Candidatus Limnocylindrales bacterium]